MHHLFSVLNRNLFSKGSENRKIMRVAVFGCIWLGEMYVFKIKGYHGSNQRRFFVCLNDGSSLR